MHIIEYTDKEYPQKLKSYKKAPQRLYCEGDISLLNTDTVAVVGTREPSEFAETYTKELAMYLALKNVAVLSGLALGIDAAAHRGALLVEGKTIAVLGSVLNNVYPKENRYLAQWIIEAGGLVVTEYIEDKYDPFRFPERDIIQALLADAVIPMQMSVRKRKDGSISYGGTENAVKAAIKYQKMLFIPRPDPADKLLYPEKYAGLEYYINQGNITDIIEYQQYDRLYRSFIHGLRLGER